MRKGSGEPAQTTGRCRPGRRTFLRALGAGLPIILARRGLEGRERWREMAADLVVVGGGLGGCAAALAALRLGQRVILTEETDWIGGQLTQQAVPPDEHPWIESFGCTRSYRQLRRRIRTYYRRYYPLTESARLRPRLNPGNGWVSRLCHEPRVALAVLRELLAPHLSGGRLTLLLEHEVSGADVEGDRVRAVTVRSRCSGDSRVLSGSYFLDATELGDLLSLTGTEYVVGAESSRETGEPHAPAKPMPHDMQAFTYCFAMDHVQGEDHTIDRPRDYEYWRAYLPELEPSWPGRLLSLGATHPITLEPRTFEFDPAAGRGLWSYRRIADRGNFAPGAYDGDISLVNWPQNDYLLGNICEVAPAVRTYHLEMGKQLSLSLLYWLQTRAPRPDGGTGWKGLRLRRDIVGTEDGLAKHPYIREARRIRARFTVLEQHVGTDARMQATGLSRDEVRAMPFADSVGIGSYRIDLHPSTGGRNYIDISSLPFQIPLGALVPQRMRNLLAAAKNIGVTHITNGCYRLHPVEWNIGEAAGALAAYCSLGGAAPADVHSRDALVADFQKTLERQGVELSWPRVTPR